MRWIDWYWSDERFRIREIHYPQWDLEIDRFSVKKVKRITTVRRQNWNSELIYNMVRRGTTQFALMYCTVYTANGVRLSCPTSYPTVQYFFGIGWRWSINDKYSSWSSSELEFKNQMEHTSLRMWWQVGDSPNPCTVHTLCTVLTSSTQPPIETNLSEKWRGETESELFDLSLGKWPYCSGWGVRRDREREERSKRGVCESCKPNHIFKKPSTKPT